MVDFQSIFSHGKELGINHPTETATKNGLAFRFQVEIIENDHIKGFATNDPGVREGQESTGQWDERGGVVCSERILKGKTARKKTHRMQWGTKTSGKNKKKHESLFEWSKR